MPSNTVVPWMPCPLLLRKSTPAPHNFPIVPVRARLLIPRPNGSFPPHSTYPDRCQYPFHFQLISYFFCAKSFNNSNSRL